MTVVHIDCECKTNSHMIKISLDKGDDDWKPCLTFSCQLCETLPFFKRLVVGTRYILGLGLRSADYFWADTIIPSEKIPEIISICNETLKDTDLWVNNILDKQNEK